MTKRNKTTLTPSAEDDGANKIYGRDAYIQRLKNGETVVFGEPGNSMVPIIHHRQKCVYAPVKSPSDLHRGDIVFCKVGPFHYTHLIKQIKEDGNSPSYLICRRDGRENGWTSYENIFAKVVQVLPATVTRKEIDEILKGYN